MVAGWVANTNRRARQSKAWAGSRRWLREGFHMNIGFIGLGIMGAPMAGHLIAAGHKLFVNTRSSVPKAITDAGAMACSMGAEVARNSEVIIVMVPDTADVEKVLFGKGGVAECLANGKTVVDMSSISPIATKDFAARVNEAG